MWLCPAALKVLFKQMLPLMMLSHSRLPTKGDTRQMAVDLNLLAVPKIEQRSLCTRKCHQ